MFAWPSVFETVSIRTLLFNVILVAKECRAGCVVRFLRMPTTSCINLRQSLYFWLLKTGNSALSLSCLYLFRIANARGRQGTENDITVFCRFIFIHVSPWQSVSMLRAFKTFKSLYDGPVKHWNKNILVRVDKVSLWTVYTRCKFCCENFPSTGWKPCVQDSKGKHFPCP